MGSGLFDSAAPPAFFYLALALPRKRECIVKKR